MTHTTKKLIFAAILASTSFAAQAEGRWALKIDISLCDRRTKQGYIVHSGGRDFRSCHRGGGEPGDRWRTLSYSDAVTFDRLKLQWIRSVGIDEPGDNSITYENKLLIALDRIYAGGAKKPAEEHSEFLGLRQFGDHMYEVWGSEIVVAGKHRRDEVYIPQRADPGVNLPEHFIQCGFTQRTKPQVTAQCYIRAPYYGSTISALAFNISNPDVNNIFLSVPWDKFPDAARELVSFAQQADITDERDRWPDIQYVD